MESKQDGTSITSTFSSLVIKGYETLEEGCSTSYNILIKMANQFKNKEQEINTKKKGFIQE